MVDAIRVVALRDGTTARELGETLGMPKSTVHRLVAGLIEVGLIQREDEGDRYVLGDVITELAAGRSPWPALIAACRPYMLTLRDQTGETIGLHVLHAERRVLLDQAESLQEHRWVHNNLRVPMPLHAGAAAKMLLAMVGPATANRIVGHDGLVSFTKSTPRSLEKLQRELETIRAQGYALSAQEVTDSIASIAVPLIPDPGPGQPLAVLSLTGPSGRLSDKALTGFLRKLQLAARTAAARLEHGVGPRVKASPLASASRRRGSASSADRAAR